MIYHFVPFDMWYWNLILHQYKWCIASRWEKGSGLQKNLRKSLAAPLSLCLFFPKLHCTRVGRHERNICPPFPLPPYSQLWYMCLKNDNSKCSGRKSPTQTRVKRGLAGKKGVGEMEVRSRGNMTAVAEGDVTHCRDLWHDSLVWWNPTGNIWAMRVALGEGNQRLLLRCQSSLSA